MFDRDATGHTRTGSPRAHGEAPEARAGGNQEDPIHGEYLAQFGADSAPFNSWDSITKWAAGHGFKGVQLPSWDTRLIDLERAAEPARLLALRPADADDRALGQRRGRGGGARDAPACRPPEGYLEAFATLYGEIAQAIRARRRGGTKVDRAVQFPGLADGVAGVEFIAAAVASAGRGGRWVRLPAPPLKP